MPSAMQRVDRPVGFIRGMVHGMTNPLAACQCIIFGAVLVWLIWASLTVWTGVEPPSGYSSAAYTRLFDEGPARLAFGNTMLALAATAALAVTLAAPCVLLVRYGRGRGPLLLGLITAAALVATPVRPEAWRNISGLIGVTSTAWAAIPAALSASLPFGALLLYLATRELRRSDIVLAQQYGIRRGHAVLSLWGLTLLRGAVGTWLVLFSIIFFDLGTFAELYRGASYTLADEIRGRFAVQAWAHLAADSAAITACSAVAVALGFWTIGVSRVQPESTIGDASRIPYIVMLAAVPSMALIIGPVIGLVCGSFSDNELILSFASGGSLRWWSSLWTSNRLQQALVLTLVDIALALAAAVPLGCAGAIDDWRRHLKERSGGRLTYVLWFLPWLIPAASLGIASSLLLRSLGCDMSVYVTGLGHGLMAAPIVASVCRARLSRITELDIGLATSYGISAPLAAHLLVWRQLAGGLLFAILLSIGVTLSDVSFAELTCGGDETITVMLRGLGRSGGTPIISVIGTLCVVFGMFLAMGLWSSLRIGVRRIL